MNENEIATIRDAFTAIHKFDSEFDSIIEWLREQEGDSNKLLIQMETWQVLIGILHDEIKAKFPDGIPF